MTIENLGRRTVLGGVAVIGASTALAACGARKRDIGAPVDPSSVKLPKSGTPLGKAADVPVGGGKIYADEKVVVTQPSTGDFKAFSAVCTHQGCLVSQVDSKKILCTCHGSEFSVTDGSVLKGPATSPLPSTPVTDVAGVLKVG